MLQVMFFQVIWGAPLYVTCWVQSTSVGLVHYNGKLCIIFSVFSGRLSMKRQVEGGGRFDSIKWQGLYPSVIMVMENELVKLSEDNG
jgi:hypothetical protein